MAGYDEFTFDLPDAALTDFSLMLDLSLCSASWWAAVDTSDGTKGRAYKQDGTTRLAIDWIDFDDVAETGFARILWSGTLPTSGTIKLRIEPPQAANASVLDSDTYGADNAYDANWAAYWPMEDFGEPMPNRLGASEALTLINSYSTLTGKIGSACSSQWGGTSIADVLDLDANFSALLWVRGDNADGDNKVVIGAQDGTAKWNIYLASGAPRLWIRDTSNTTRSVTSGTDVTDGAWHHIAQTFDFASLGSIFVDAGTPTTTDISALADTTILGETELNRVDGAFAGSMDLDEVQLHSTVRSAEWIKHEYDQTNAPATFWGTATWNAASGTDYPLNAGTGAFTLTGVDAGLAVNRTLAADAGAFTLTAVDAGLAVGRVLDAATGTYTATAIDAGLTISRELAAAAGAFTLTGVDATLSRTRQITAESGEFTLTGQAASLVYAGSYSMEAEVGAFTATGVDAGLTVARRIAVDAANYALTGVDATLTYTELKTLTSEAGAFTLTGTAATLTYSGEELPILVVQNILSLSRPITVHSITRPITVYEVPSGVN